MKFLSLKTSLFLVSIILLIGTLLMTQQMVKANAEKSMPAPHMTNAYPQVSIIWSQADSYTGNVSAYGEIHSHYQVSLTAQVAGQIESISTKFDNGYHLKQGDWLAKLENSDYIASVEQAKQTLASSQVSLLEEQRQGQQALMEWQSSGLSGQPDSDLVLRHPQLQAAQTAVEQAKASLKSAEKDLSYTTIKAPFDAVVIQRMIAPGSYVQKGSDIATLYSTDRVEVEIALSDRDWQNLPKLDVLNGGRWPAKLTSVEDGTTWTGYVIRSGQHVDSDTRQRSLVIAVDKPFDQKPAIYPGTFIKAEIAGKQRDHLWKLPASALSQRGDIWFVDANNSLAKISTTPLFTTADSIFVEVPEALSQQKVAILSHPLNSYLTGMKVTPVEMTHE